MLFKSKLHKIVFFDLPIAFDTVDHNFRIVTAALLTMLVNSIESSIHPTELIHHKNKKMLIFMR